MSNRKKYGFSSFGVGIALAVLFFILMGTSSGSTSSSYLAAAIVCLVAGAAGLIIALTDRS